MVVVLVIPELCDVELGLCDAELVLCDNEPGLVVLVPVLSCGLVAEVLGPVAGQPDEVDEGVAVTVALEVGRGAEASQLRTSKATVPRMLMKCATLYM